MSPLSTLTPPIAASLLLASPGVQPSTDTVSNFAVRLTGQAEVNLAHPAGGTGDPNASGWARISINPGARRVCYELELSRVEQPMMAHIHQGAVLHNGPPVIILFVGTGESLRNCVASTRSQLSEIVSDPHDYYVSIDSTAYPDGAVRGQL